MLVLALLVSIVLVAGSQGCSCFGEPLQTTLCTAERLVIVGIQQEIDGIDFTHWRHQWFRRQYNAIVLHVFRGDDISEEDEIVIETAANKNDGLCGVILPEYTVMLLELQLLDDYRPAYTVTECNLVELWDSDYEHGVSGDLITDFVQGTLDCDCLRSGRYDYHDSPCCPDFQYRLSVKECTDHYGYCKKVSQSSKMCVWDWDSNHDYIKCLNELGLTLNDQDGCVSCPKYAEYQYYIVGYLHKTCEGGTVLPFATENKFDYPDYECKCPDDRPLLDTVMYACVSEADCPGKA